MIEQIALVVYHFFGSLGVVGVFISMFIENIGIPLPTEIGYLIAQDLINRQVVPYALMLCILTFGHVAGATLAYYIGRWGEEIFTRHVAKNHRFKLVDATLKKWYATYGDVTVFTTRFIGYIRPWSSFVAGYAQVKVVPFIIWTTLGSLIFNIFNLYLSGIIIVIWRRYAVYHVAIVATSFILFFGFIFIELARRMAKTKQR